MRMHPSPNWPTSAAGAWILAAALASTTAAAAEPKSCDMQLTVTLTPDIPNPSDDEFLSPLLSNHTGYELTLRQQPSRSVVIVELIGPGPDYRCYEVVETMRKDGRVVSVDHTP